MPPLPLPKPGDVVAERYTVRERLDDWGVGDVFLAEDGRFADRAVVVKLLPPGDEALLEVLDARIERARTVRDEHIVPLVDHGRFEGRCYAVHQYVAMRSVGAWIDALTVRGALPPLGAVRRIAEHVCQALRIAREESPPLFHEGISPATVLLRGEGDDLVARVVDFGIVPFADAVVAAPGSARGIACMAPEQFQGDEADARTDVFSAALLVLEMLALPPETAAPDAAVQYMARADVPDAVWHVLQRAMRSARDERFDTVDAFAGALAGAWADADDAHEEALPPAEPEPAAPTTPEPVAGDLPPAATPEIAAPPAPATPSIRLYDDAPAPVFVVSPEAPMPAPFELPPLPAGPSSPPLTAAMPAFAPPAPMDLPTLPRMVQPASLRAPAAPLAPTPPAAPAEPELDVGRPSMTLVLDPKRSKFTLPVAPPAEVEEDDEPAFDGGRPSRTLVVDFGRAFGAAADGTDAAVNAMRANRDPHALADLAQRYRAHAAHAHAPDAPTPAPTPALMPAPMPAPAAPFHIGPPRAPATAAMPSVPSSPAAPAAPSPAEPVAAEPEPSDARRLAVSVAAVLLGFGVAFGIVWALLHLRRH